MTIVEQSQPSVGRGNELVQQLAARFAITQLVYTVARAMDARDWDLLTQCFSAQPTGDFATGTADGVDAVIAEYKRFLTPLDVTQHLVGNVEVTLEGSGATSHATFQAQHLRHDADGTGQYLLGGTYDDTLLHTPSGWKIADRRVRGLWSHGDRSVLGATLSRAPRRDAVDADS